MSAAGVNLTPRVRELFNLVTAEKIGGASTMSTKKKKGCLKDVVIDYSQNPIRRCFTSGEGYLHTLCTSSHLYHMGLDRIILPSEHLWLQGHNPHVIQIPSSLSPEEVRCLAGEGMALPSLAMSVFCRAVGSGFGIGTASSEG